MLRIIYFINNQITKYMKHVRIVGVLFGLVFLASFSCSKLNNCEESDWINIPFETLGNDTIIYWLENIDEMKTNVFVVIKNQNDFEKYVRCNYEPMEIDFNSQILLAGRYRHHQCAVFDSQQILICENKLYYKVRMIEQICAAFTNVHYFAVIDRQYENLPVVFDVKFSN